MAKYLFIVPPFYGHINPTLGIGSELLKRGHEVVWVGLKEIDDAFIPPGGKFIVPKEFEKHRREIEQICGRQEEGTLLRGMEILSFVMEVTYIPFCNYMVDGLLNIIDEFQPDVIIHDETMFAGAICATLKNIPYVTSIPVPPGSFQPTANLFPKFEAWQTQEIINLQKKFGIPGEGKIVYSDLLNLVYTSRQLVGDGDSFPDHYKFVGPIIKGRQNVGVFDFEKLKQKDRPVIYVSLGTVLNEIRKSFFTKIIDAFADQPLTIIAATNPDIFEEWPDNFIVQSYVPQSELLPYVDAVIYHGGFNTVNESLYHGIPMLIIPMAYDQFHIASLVVNAGSGLSLKYKRLNREDLKISLWEILQNPKYKQAATKMSETLKKAGGTDEAVKQLEDLKINDLKIEKIQD